MTCSQIAYPRLRELLADPATQLVEVLSPDEYRELHLPRAPADAGCRR